MTDDQRQIVSDVVQLNKLAELMASSGANPAGLNPQSRILRWCLSEGLTLRDQLERMVEKPSSVPSP